MRYKDIDMVAVTEQGWTLHYTIGDVVCGPVSIGDVIHLPGDRGDVTVLGGNSPRRVKDVGSVNVSDTCTVGGLYARPDAIGCLWVHQGGGVAR